MAFVQLRRSFWNTRPTRIIFCALGSGKLQLMAKVQCRAFQSHVDLQLRCLPVGNVCIYKKHTRVVFSKMRVSCKMAAPVSTVLKREIGLGCPFSRNVVWGYKDGGSRRYQSTHSVLNAVNGDSAELPKKKAPSGGKKTAGGPSESLSRSAESSKKASPVKNHKKDRKGLLSETSVTNLTRGMEASDVAVSNKPLPKKSTKSRRKKKVVEETDVVEEENGALPYSEKEIEHLSSHSKPSEKLYSKPSSKVKQLKAKILKPLYPPSVKSVVVVESLTKAKVIQRYLGDMYEVIPSYGHVRDLAARSGSVRPDEDFSMVWEVPSAAWTHLKSIKVAVSGADNLILASDPDREGEAIAWHIIEMLTQQDSLRKDLTVARVMFQEITESAVKTALQSPRDINVNLVHAYLARRALDYLIGFNISPLLWRKLPGCQSAGRVQSAALSLICDREIEIDEFKPQEYWSVDTIFKGGSSTFVETHLTHFSSKKLNQLSIGSEAEAKKMEQIIKSSTFKVMGSKKSHAKRTPPTPYITSTLQQDAANKLNFSASNTMRLAQKLYEGVELSNGMATGLITYMRTDGLHMSDEAVKDIRALVLERYGKLFVPESPRKYFRKVKNAQEAHEAIRPTDIKRLPSTLAGILDENSFKLYSLIWSRTMACQMESAKICQIQLDLGSDDKCISFRAAGSRVDFPGYKAVYEDVEMGASKDNDSESNDRDEGFVVLSNLRQGDPLDLGTVILEQHHTQPPPRYSEASLVKKLEELGIGRPSTYATTLKVLQDRNYVTVKSRILYPEFRGRMVSAFLSHHFSEVTDYSFTADMETELDNVSAGITEWKGLLKDYWTRFNTYCERAGKVHIHQVEKMLERTFEDFLFSSLPDANRTCPSCYEGTLIFKVSRFGAGYFIGCDQHPRCKYIAKTIYGDEEEDTTPKNATLEEPKELGVHPISKEKVLLKNGPYGHYVQLGEDRKGYLPKRASVSQIKDVGSITIEDALDLLRYPITLGNHPKDGQPVVLKLAKLGFTIRYRRHIAPVPKNVKPRDITMEKALELLKGENVKQCGRPKSKKKTEDAVEAF